MDKRDIVMAEVTLTHDDDDDPYGMGMGGGPGDNGVTELMERYRINPGDLPTYRLFLKNEDPSHPKTIDETTGFVEWIESHGVYLGADGCLAEFDSLIWEFVAEKEKDSKRDEIGRRAKAFMGRFEENGEDPDAEKLKSAKYYIKVMAKIIADGEQWVDKEGERLSGIVMEGNMNNAKKPWFLKRLNILTVFAQEMERNRDADGDKADL